MKNIQNLKTLKTLKNASVINSIIVAAVIMVSALFFFIPYIMEQYTIKTIIAHSKNSVEQIKLIRAYYVDAVVDDIKKYAPNITFHYDHKGVNGRLPLPTTTIYDLSKIFSENTGIKYNLYSDYPFANRKDRVLTDFQKEAIKYTKKNKDGVYVKRDTINGKEVLRVATTDYMTDQSCVNCHNNHIDRTWEANKWKLGDKRGVLEVITPLENELADHKIMRNYIIIFIIITFGTVLLYLFYKIRKRENELFEVNDKLEDTVNNKNKKIQSMEKLTNHYIISSKTDTKGIITDVSQAFIEISGYSKEELLNKPHNLLRHPDMLKSTFKDMWKTIQLGKTWRGEVKNLKKDGDFYWVDAVISADFDDDNNIIGYNAVRQNITAQKEAYYLAYHDFLTSLPNRAKFEEIASHAIKSAQRNNNIIAILFIDLDKFKNINDTLGHHYGDEMLKVVSKRMQNILKDIDTISRIGGDEFVILLESITNTKHIETIVNRILDILRKPIEIFNNTVYTTASIGISMYPDNGKTVSKLMRYADSAMYHAKDMGRDSYQFYSEELNILFTRKIAVEKAVKDAITNNSFDFVFQPKYNLISHKCSSCEVLLRLTDKELGFISPAEFIPIAEENNMIIDIGNIVFKKAVQTFKKWKDIDLGIEQISINISSTQLSEENIVAKYLNIIKENNILPTNIELELTEHSMIDDLDKNIKVLTELRDLGFEISIDDFGTGYSSMSYLKKLPIDTIKIDKSFIDDIAINKDDLAIAHAIIQISNDLGYKIIAEGIEDIKQENILIDLGCKYGQGFIYSKGLSNEDFISFINKE